MFLPIHVSSTKDEDYSLMMQTKSRLFHLNMRGDLKIINLETDHEYFVHMVLFSICFVQSAPTGIVGLRQMSCEIQYTYCFRDLFVTAVKKNTLVLGKQIYRYMVNLT